MSFEIVECKYRVSRKAPRELIQNFPELWKRLAIQRFAWMQISWLIIFLLLIGIANWAAAIIFLGVWIWQRNRPIFLVCKTIELLIYLYFTLLVLGSVTLINTLPGGPFAPILLVGAIVLFYEGSARSWHYLFNYMALVSSEFSDLAISNKWVVQSAETRKRTKLPILVAVSGLILSVVIITVLELLSEL
jgi:hypothetical protein